MEEKIVSSPPRAKVVTITEIEEYVPEVSSVEISSDSKGEIASKTTPSPKKNPHKREKNFLYVYGDSEKDYSSDKVSKDSFLFLEPVPLTL